MRPFTYTGTTNRNEALKAFTTTSHYLSGGTNLVDLMKEHVEQPDQLIYVKNLQYNGISKNKDGSYTIGAMRSNADTANHKDIRLYYPLLSMAMLSAATAQIRNMATNGGNLLQRTRCPYFFETSMPCNKREPGSGCGAIDGIAHLHAVLGTSPSCIATYPGDMAVALSALDATVEIASPDSDERSVPVRDFHLLPGDTPWRDNVLERGEIITAVTLPRPVKAKHLYRKVRERSSYAFALVSVAAIAAVEDGVIARADLAFGGLAHKPWHDPRLSELLVGEAPSAALFDKAADLLLEGARGYGENDFKIPLARRTLAAVMAEATEIEI